MSTDAAHTVLDRAVVALTAAWTLGCIALIVFYFVQNPMDERRKHLDSRLSLIFFVDESFDAAEELDYRQLNDRVMGKQALWEDLIAPPPPPPVVEKGPDLDALIKGIRASAREELKTPQGVKIRIRTPENAGGAWRGVGEKVNGMTITEIAADQVTFRAHVKGKDYDIPVKRN